MRRITGLDWPLAGLAACLLALTVVGSFWITSFDDGNAGYHPALASGALCPRGMAHRPRRAAGRRRQQSRSRQHPHRRHCHAAAAAARARRCRPTSSATSGTAACRAQASIRICICRRTRRCRRCATGRSIPYINRADYAPTIYPPMSQIVFYLITRISEATLFMKVAMLAFEGLAVWAILQLLAARGLPRSRVLLYAWHPLPLWEFARSGHIDIVAIAFLLLAFVAVERRIADSCRRRARSRRAGQVFSRGRGAGALQALGLASAGRLRRNGRRSLPALSRRRHEGVRISRPLRQRGGLRPGVRHFPLAAPRRHRPAASAGASQSTSPVAAAIMAVLALFVVLREQGPGADLAGAMLLAVAFTILFSPHYAWYFAWLVPFLCFYPVIGVVYLTCAASYLYFAHWPPTVSDGLVIYGPCVLILVARVCVPSPSRINAKEIGGAPCRSQSRACGRSAALFRERRQAAQRARGEPAGLRLSRDHQPLQSAVHDLSAHL